MADRRVKVTFSAEIQNYKAAMEAAAKSTEKVKKASEDAGNAQEQAGKKSTNATKEAAAAAKAAAKAAADAAKAETEAAKKRADSIQRVGEASALGGATLLAGVALATKGYADFDKQMSSVDAATHETAGNMQLLRDAAVKAGADTAFSAAEAGQGIEELAKAGVSTKDILAGGLSGSLALAAAGSLGVGDAAEIAASALTQFKLSGDQVPHVADLLAAGAGKAQGSVHDLGEALNQSGLVASSTGLTIEETTGSLAAFASAGLTGSDAGTSFKTMLMSLNPNSKEAAALMDELGIRAYDAQGKFVGMAKYAGILQTALKNKSDEERSAALKTIFGSDAVRAANVLYEQGADGINKWENAVNDAGYAADTAARMQNNLAGDLEKLGGSFDTVLIQSGSGANEVLRGLVQGLEGLVDTVGKVPAPVLAVGTGLAAVVGGAGLLAGGLITVIPKIKETKDALEVLAPAGGKARDVLGTAGAVAGKAAGAYAALATAAALAASATEGDRKKTTVEDFSNALLGVAKNGSAAESALDGAFKNVYKPDLITGGTTAVNSYADALDRVLHASWQDSGADFAATLFGQNATSGINTAKDAIGNYDKALAAMAKSGNFQDAAAGFALAAKKAKDNGDSIETILPLFPAYKEAVLANKTANGETQVSQDALVAAMLKADPAAKDAAKGADTLKESIAKTGVELGGVISDMDKFLEQLFATGQITMSARDAEAAYNESLRNVPKVMKEIADSKGAMGRTLNDNATDFDLTTEAGSKANAALQDIAQKGMAEVAAQAKEGMGQPELQKTLNDSYEDIKKNADVMGIHGKAADDLARKILGVPPNVDVKTWIEQTASAQADALKKQLDDLNGKRISLYIDTFKTSFERRVGLPSTIADGSYGQGQGVYAIPPSTPSNPLNVGGKATGGRLAGFADGGQLPTTGPGTGTTDGFLGISSAGVPLARVDAGEWIIKRSSSARYNRELAAINAGTFPKLPGFAGGGRAYAAQSSAAGAAGRGGIHIDLSGAQFTALDPVALRRDIVDDITYELNTKGGMRVV